VATKPTGSADPMGPPPKDVSPTRVPLPPDVIVTYHMYSPAPSKRPPVWRPTFFRERGGVVYRLEVRGVMKYDPTLDVDWEDVKTVTSAEWVREKYPSLEVVEFFKQRMKERPAPEDHIDITDKELSALGFPAVGESRVAKGHEVEEMIKPNESSRPVERSGNQLKFAEEEIPQKLQTVSADDIMKAMKTLREEEKSDDDANG